MSSAKTVYAGTVQHQKAPCEEFLSGLTREDKLLIMLRDELYGQSWDELEADLRHRTERKPHICDITQRIDEDLARIARLRDCEDRYGVDLATLIAQSPGEV